MNSAMSRFAWVNGSADSALLQALAQAEPALAHCRAGAALRGILAQWTYGAIWSRPEWTMEAWRAQRVPVSVLRSAVDPNAAVLPKVAGRLAESSAGDVSLMEACSVAAEAMRELSAVVGPVGGRRVTPSSGMTFEQWQGLGFSGHDHLVEWANGVRRTPPALVRSLLLHGSAADGHVAPGYSDVDMHAVIATPRDASGQDLFATLEWLVVNQSVLHRFNPFAHHGFMLTLEAECRFLSEASLPSALLQRGVWILPAAGAMEYVPDTLGAVRAIAGMEMVFEQRFREAVSITGPFDAIWWTSSALLLPLLLWQLMKCETLYKPEGIARCGEILSPGAVDVIHQLEAIRARIGKWIEQHPQVFREESWPGAALHRARKVMFTEADRADLGITDDLVRRGEALWEEVAHTALRFVEGKAESGFASRAEKFFFAWPAHVSEIPRPVALSAYENAREKFLTRAAAEPSVRAVYEFGKIGSAGLSDLDFLLVMAPGAGGTPPALQLCNLPPEIADIMGHDAITISEEAVNHFPVVFPLFESRQLSGAARPLPSTFSLPRQTVAPMLTRLTAVKYPNDIAWLCRQPKVRWKTLLAYLNSFRHVQECLAFLGIPSPERVNRCVAMNQEIRKHFATEGTATRGDLRNALLDMLHASVDVLFALENWWRTEQPLLGIATDPADPEAYRTALLESIAGSSTPPPHPPAIRAVLRRCGMMEDNTASLYPQSAEADRFHQAFDEYLASVRAFVAIETAADRTPSPYIFGPIPLRAPEYPEPVRLAAVEELANPAMEEFLLHLNAFAAEHGLRMMTNWSKAWEYPWIWLNGLRTLSAGQTLVDLGSELSPVPWFLATRGIKCILIEADPQFEPLWESLRSKLGVDVEWRFVNSEVLPLPDASADALTSFSVIEHQPDKRRAVDEIVRVLKPGGMFGVSFDICEPELGMTFPAWNGRALTLQEFEETLWRHPAFGKQHAPAWNREDMAAFKEWHLRSAAHHNYVVGATVLRKR
ncbi:MAG: class I SAM-dependent methyltransferase [Phycisphaerae bacterium]